MFIYMEMLLFMPLHIRIGTPYIPLSLHSIGSGSLCLTECDRCSADDHTQWDHFRSDQRIHCNANHTPTITAIGRCHIGRIHCNRIPSRYRNWHHGFTKDRHCSWYCHGHICFDCSQSNQCRSISSLVTVGTVHYVHYHDQFVSALI